MFKMITYVIVFFILLGICIYMVRNKMKKKEVVEEEKICEFLYFYTTWCPYCKKSMVEWNKFKGEWNHRKYDGYEMVFREIDCDTNEALANKYKVETYPTIKMIKDNSIIDFDAKPTVDTLTQFLNTSFQ
jgi:thiol-disulfide isomerase/thioredoxin